MVLAMFVLFLLASTGAALLFLADSEQESSKANNRASQAFYIAEAGLERARQALYDANGLDTFDDDLTTAAGANGTIDVAPDGLTPVFDSNGNLTGVNGAGNDVPLLSVTSLNGGRTLAYLTNDPLEGRSTTDDENDRLAIVAVGAGANRTFEVVEAVIERRPPIPLVPPSTITMLGPTPDFHSATSKVKDYVGDDCAGTGFAGVTDLYVPIVGTIGDAAESVAESGRATNPEFYIDGALDIPDPITHDSDSFANLTDSSEPSLNSPSAAAVPNDSAAWNDCATLQSLLADLRARADHVCRSGTCNFPDYGPDTVLFIEGDYTLGPSESGGQGVLVCTGELTLNGRTNWSGLILAVGEGAYRINGSGNGQIIGGLLIADIAGADNVYGTADDCQSGSSGLGQTVYDERGGGNALNVYCSTALNNTNVRPYEVVDFLQH